MLPATDVNRAELAARKVLHDLEHPFTADGRAVIASASIGIAGFPIHAATGPELLQRADAAMYTAKTPRVGYSVYSRNAIAASTKMPGLPSRCGRRSTRSSSGSTISRSP